MVPLAADGAVAALPGRMDLCPHGLRPVGRRGLPPGGLAPTSSASSAASARSYHLRGSAPIFGGVVGGGGWLKRSLKNLGSGSRGPSGGGGGGDDDDDDDVGDVDADDDEAAALDEEEEAADVREVRKAEAHQGVWVLLVGAAFCALLGPSGGLYALRFATPAAAAAAASCFFPLAALRSGLEAKSTRPYGAAAIRCCPPARAWRSWPSWFSPWAWRRARRRRAASGTARSGRTGTARCSPFSRSLWAPSPTTLDTSDDIHTRAWWWPSPWRCRLSGRARA